MRFKQVDVFTDRPFLGNPVAVVIGSAHAALESGFVAGKDKLTQECGAGIIGLSIEGAEIYLRAPDAKVSAMASNSFALAALDPDMGALAVASTAAKAGGITLFAPSGDKETAIHVRSFAPAHGINEDPVCGSGNISVAA